MDKTNIPSFIEKVITEAITDRFNEIFEVQKEELIERLDRKKDEMLAIITLQIFKQINIIDFGETITISLKTEELKNK
jgi:hypothetical protein